MGTGRHESAACFTPDLAQLIRRISLVRATVLRALDLPVLNTRSCDEHVPLTRLLTSNCHDQVTRHSQDGVLQVAPQGPKGFCDASRL